MEVMDKSVLAGGVLCFVADLFAIASLAMPEWVISKFSGKISSNILYVIALNEK